MRTLLMMTASLALIGCATTAKLPANNVPVSADGFYGEKFTVGNPAPIDSVRPLPSDVREGAPETVVKARVSSICPKKGCWMKVGKGTPEDLRVTFYDYGFFVPSKLVGQEVAMKGKFIVYNETIEEQKHLLEDAKRPKSEIDAIKSPRQILRFEATGVKDLTVN